MFVLGIDGGGTKTHAAIVDEAGHVRGTGLGGPSNYDDVGEAAAREHVAAAVAAARTAAGLAARPFDAAFLGMAGVVSAADHAVIRRIAADLDLAAPERVGVDHDCRIALAGGLLARPGIVLIAGTGSSCYGRNDRGEDWRAGGWGPLISDEGGGYWLGLHAIKRAVCAHDGRGVPTCLLARVMEQLGLEEMDELMHRLYVKGLSRTEVAALAPLVVDAAREEDPVACELLEEGSDELALCVQVVARRLGMHRRRFDVALVGGILGAGEVVSQPLCRALRRRIPQARPTFPALPPVFGACLLALQLVGVELGSSLEATLRRESHAEASAAG